MKPINTTFEDTKDEFKEVFGKNWDKDPQLFMSFYQAKLLEILIESSTKK